MATKRNDDGRGKPRPSHLNWRCPKCGKKYNSPVFATAVGCLPNKAHTTTIEMKPVEEGS